ncbi:MAG: DNA polymerase III subunit alpha [Deltaproteobacteria bacterium]|nr:DNA polymerase III subunit alpha [Deltaproteobacteria bacterium]MBI3295035.1 DNA polymerase III subunit alpha [Deltaproteobacteria bacterium]
MAADFTHLHVHTEYSLLDSAIRVDALCKAAVADKMDSVAITDHGNLFGALDFYMTAKEHGIKPILGCEVYLAPGNRFMKGTHFNVDDEVAPYASSRSGMHHLILWVMNEVGYRNLCQLVSLAYLEGFYYKPRVDKELLGRYNEGLLASSACLKGEIPNLCLLGDMDRARLVVDEYRSLFPDRFFLEMQNGGIPQQVIVNQHLQELAATTKTPLVATADCHYLRREDAFHQEVLLSIQTGKPLEADPSGAGLHSSEYYFKSQVTMKEEFSFCPEAISNTRLVTERCNFEYRFKDENGRKIYHLPDFKAPDGLSREDYLRKNAAGGLTRFLEKAKITETKRYWDRLERELKVVIEMGFAGYYLIVSDFIGHAKDNGIPVGPGRGSGAGSLVAFVLRITELDPLEHGLLFERFLNPERVSLPDFDVDFCMERRDEIINYVSEKYGKESVAQIITFGKLQARGVIRDVGRVLGFPVPEVDRIAKLVPETLNITLDKALEAEPRLKQLTEKDPKVGNLISIARSLEGLYRHASIHAAGLVISNRPMVEHCPLYRGKNDELVIQFDMVGAEEIGLVKFDFLGLKTLTFLKNAERLVNQRHNAGLNLSEISLQDKPTLELLARGDTHGIFQLESSGMQDLLRRVKPDCFADIVAITSLYRPGPMVMLDDFIARKHKQVPVVFEFEELRSILSETYGIMVYQEQVMQIAVTLASYTAGGADLLRRAMGKKKVEEMEKQKAIFLEGATKNGHDSAKAEKLFDLMANFAGYGFNKSHAAAYSVITGQTAYLKARYPVEFFAALLSVERENTDKITKYIADAKRHSIEIHPPDINQSETNFTVVSEKEIRFGLGAIKGVGQIAIDSVLEGRKSGHFTDLFDLTTRTNGRVVNKRVLEAFVKAGALDSFGVNRASLFKAIDEAVSLGSSVQKTLDDNQSSFIDFFEDKSFAHRKVVYPNVSPWERLEELKLEKETIGFFVSGHPLDGFKKELERYTTGTIGDCVKARSTADVMVGADVTALKEFINRRGERMAFLTLSDSQDSIEAVCLPDVYQTAETIIKAGNPLWIRGHLEAKPDGNKLILTRKNNAAVLPLQYAYEALAREIHLYWPLLELGPEKLMQLKTFLDQQRDKKGLPGFIHLQTGKKAATTLRLKETIPLHRETIHFLRHFVAQDGGSVEFH